MINSSLHRHSYPTRGDDHARQDQRQHYPATQGLQFYHESQNAQYSAQQSNFPPQITHGRGNPALQSYQGQHCPGTQTVSSISESDIDSLNTRQADWSTQISQGVSSDRWGSRIGQDYTRQHNPASQRRPPNYEGRSGSLNTQRYHLLPHTTQRVSSNPTVEGSYQSQHSPSTQTAQCRSYASQSDAFDTGLMNFPRQTTVGASSDPIRSGNEDTRHNVQHNPEQIPIQLCDPFSDKLFKLSQHITDDNLEDMKRLCKGNMLTERELQSLKHPFNFFDKLRSKGFIHENDTKLVATLLNNIGLNALVGMYFTPSANQGNLVQTCSLRLVHFFRAFTEEDENSTYTPEGQIQTSLL
ncbi:uncharacterized protein [Ptychodera flava]|uniref:uncharacterized protein n=1 Tax=Ptychodera flava TaxID=63121 RepID=UPI003969E59D